MNSYTAVQPQNSKKAAGGSLSTMNSDTHLVKN